MEADTKEVNYQNSNIAIKNITKTDEISSGTKTYISSSNIRYNSSTYPFQSTRQRIKRQLNNTKQTKIVNANRITKLFNNKDNCTNFTGKYGHTNDRSK